MCQEVWIDGEMITNLGQMRKALGCEPVHDALDGFPSEAFALAVADDSCLCHLRHIETAALVGRIVEWNEWGDMVYAPAPTTGDTP